MRHEINYPTETTYFIAYTDINPNANYGIVHPDQCLVTGQPNLWTSLSEAEWLKELKDVFNIIPDPELTE